MCFPIPAPIARCLVRPKQSVCCESSPPSVGVLEVNLEEKHLLKKMNTSVERRSDWSIESFATDRRIVEVEGPLTVNEIDLIENIYHLFLGGHPITERELYAFLACLSRYVGFQGSGMWTKIAKMINRQENRPREYKDGNDLFQRVKKAFPRIAKK